MGYYQGREQFGYTGARQWQDARQSAHRNWLRRTIQLPLNGMLVFLCFAALIAGQQASALEVSIPDPALEAALRSALSIPVDPIQDTDLALLNVLTAFDFGIVDLTGLEYCTNLTSLTLSNNEITDLSPLSGLTGLTELLLGNNQIADLGPLSGLGNLTDLRLEFNQISDLTPLSELASLTDVNLYNNQIVDLTPLSGLTSLDELDLSNNQIIDAAPVAGLTTLTYISLDGNQVTEITPLSGLTALTLLELRNNQISDVAPLATLSSLEELALTGNPVADVTPLTGLTSLNYLLLDATLVCDLTPLVDNAGLATSGFVSVEATPLSAEACTTQIPALTGRGVTVVSGTSCDGGGIAECPVLANIPDPNFKRLLRDALGIPTLPLFASDLATLTYLSITSNYGPITDLTGIEYCTGLLTLDINDLPISALPSLASLSALEGLFVYDNPALFDLSGLSALPNLKRLELQRNAFSDLGALSGLTTLTRLYCEESLVSDLTPLTGLTNLLELEVIGTQVADLSPLSGLTQLEVLYLGDNQINDLSDLSGFSSLQRLSVNGNQLADVDSLPSLPALQSLDLADNQINTLSGLPELPALSSLGIAGNSISDLSPLSALTQLVYLNMDENPITDLSPLSTLVSLEELEASELLISDLTPLASLSALTYLYIESNQITDTSPLSSLLNLEDLGVRSNQITDLAPLASLPSLVYLYANNNEICDPSPLLGNLNYVAANGDLRLADNPLTADGCAAAAEIEALGVDVNTGTACNGGGLALCPSECSDPSGNLIQNGGYEASLDGWEQVPLGESGTFLQSTRGVAGSVALGFERGGIVGAQTGAIRQAVTIPSASGALLEYAISLDVFGPDTTGELKVFVDETLVESIDQTFLPLGVFLTRNVDLSLYADNEQHTISFAFSVSSGTGAGSMVYLDEIRLTACGATGEGVVDGEGDVEGAVDGEGVVDGEGDVEGAVDGEGIADGEGTAEGEGSPDGEGTAEGEGTTEGEGIEIPDVNLEAAIRDALGIPSGPLFASNLASLGDLLAFNRGIQDLTGLEYCVNLTSLNLGVNQITDLSPIASLTNLSDLSINNNLITDLSPIAGLSSLTTLSQGGNEQLSDLGALAGLTGLTILYADSGQIADITPLAALTSLTYLNLYNNDIVDLGPLTGLASLGTIEISNNLVCDISPLLANAGIGAGDTLNLSFNPLGVAACGTDIATLTSRGVTVSAGATCVGGGVLSCEGATDGEGLNEGEGAAEGNVDGEGVAEGEGEGQVLDPFEHLLYTFASADVDSNSLVTLAEILAQLPQFTQGDFDFADANDDGSLSVAELLEASSAQVILSADTSGDFLVSLSELLRVVQLYNAGGYACAANPGATEDGFTPEEFPGLSACVLHGLDRDGDNRISLSELLRGIQVFSFAGYSYCDGQSEDSFCDRT